MRYVIDTPHGYGEHHGTMKDHIAPRRKGFVCTIAHLPGVLASLSLLSCTFPAHKASDGHLTAEKQPLAKTTTPIPAPVQASALPARPGTASKVETYSVVVQNVEAKELLFALARDAKLNMDIHPGIQGTVTLNAISQTLPQILERLARQVDMRWELDGRNLAVMPDSPYLRTYKVDYVNMARIATGTVSIATQVATSVPGSSGGSGQNMGASSNNSMTRIENTAKNQFWENLAQNIKDILRETDKILPEGSSEEYEEVSGNVATSGSGAQPGASSASTRSHGGSHGQGGGQPPTAASVLAGSPHAAELQNKGTRVVRRTTFREAASVIANPETGILTVRATQRQHAKIQEFLDQVLTSARRQVLIEATVAEVRLDRGYLQGIDWSASPFGKTGWTFSQSSAAGTTLNQTGSAKFSLGYANAASAIGNISAVVKALESFGTVKVLSSPKISVLNNQTAVLKVVDNEVYFTIKADTTVSSNVAAQTTYTTTINSVPVGFVMNVTPQISETDSVVLNVRPSISRKIGTVSDPNPALSAANVQSLIPVIRTREMESVMRIQNGAVAVMGGLMEDNQTNQDNGVPGLGRLPVIGGLFSNQDHSDTRTELVVFLRPTIIRDPSLKGDYRQWRDALPGKDFFEVPEAPSPANPR